MRYEEVDESTLKLFASIRNSIFKEFDDAKIKLLFDTKKRMSHGQIVLASIRKPNELLRHFTQQQAMTSNGFDYIITIDRECWNVIEDNDKTRILRHELRHAKLDLGSEIDIYKIVDHDITDFYDEIALNSDDQEWRKRLVTLTSSIYEQKKEAEKEKRRNNK